MVRLGLEVHPVHPGYWVWVLKDQHGPDEHPTFQRCVVQLGLLSMMGWGDETTRRRLEVDDARFSRLVSFPTLSS